MPRGAREDVGVTKLLFANGLLLDRDSFVSLNANEPHLFLYGDDITCQRQRVWHRGKHKCASCGMAVGPFSQDWEMDHIQGGLVGRCDCLHNLQILCRPCHKKKTRQSEHH